VSIPALVLLVTVGAPQPSEAQEAVAGGEAALAEARQLFDALDYEQAVPALDRAVSILQPAAQQPGPERTALLRAYEMRARAKFGLGDTEGASADFRMLLELDPTFMFDAQVSPRVVALLETVRKATIGAVVLKVEPADAAVEIDGRAVSVSPEPVAIRAGELVLKLSRSGYRPMEERVTVTAGEAKEVSLSMERIAAAIYLVTSPPDTEILVDGSSRGRTGAGPLPAEYAGVPERLDVTPDKVSQPLVLTDLPLGTHAVQFKSECYVTEERQLVIDRLADYRVEAVRLQPAVGEVSVESTPPGADVYIDGVARGSAPVRLADVCEGERTIELRSRSGRFSRTIRLTPGATETIQGVLKPAFALLPSGDTGSSGSSDVQNRVERALAASREVMVFSPSGTEIEAAMEGHPVPPDWLTFDASGRPVGAAAAVTDAVRRDLSTKLAEGLNVQGVAAVNQPSATSPEVVLSLLAAGAGEPDVVALLIDRAESVNEAIARLDYVPPLFRHGVGLTAIEVLDTTGLPIVAVDQTGPAARAGIRPGEIVINVDGKDVSTVADFERALERKRRGEAADVDVRDRSGATRTVQVPVATTLRLIAASDRSILFNVLAAALRGRLAAADELEQPYVQLNLAVALLRLGDYQGARDALRGAQLPPGDGVVSQGTQHFLLGLAHEGLGEVASADQAWRSAVASGGLLTEEGPSITGLAERKLDRSSPAAR
jgi:tetratricopeptide (TPR) repeat protein